MAESAQFSTKTTLAFSATVSMAILGQTAKLVRKICLDLTHTNPKDTVTISVYAKSEKRKNFSSSVIFK